MIVELPWPPKLLWPNGGRSKINHVAAVKKSFRHAEWATILARKNRGEFVHDGGEIPVRLVVYAKPHGPLPDKDNCVAAVKNALDGIATGIGVNDKHFAAPVVEFAKPRCGKIEVHLG
jgi:crossover junction endodeoxyribonuclease RusA